MKRSRFTQEQIAFALLRCRYSGHTNGPETPKLCATIEMSRMFTTPSAFMSTILPNSSLRSTTAIPKLFETALMSAMLTVLPASTRPPLSVIEGMTVEVDDRSISGSTTLMNPGAVAVTR